MELDHGKIEQQVREAVELFKNMTNQGVAIQNSKKVVGQTYTDQIVCMAARLHSIIDNRQNVAVTYMLLPGMGWSRG